MKKYLVLIVSSLVIIGLIWFYRFAENNGTTKCELKYEKISGEVQAKIIEDKKIISQRQAIAKSVSSDGNLEWLRQNRCKDCSSK